MEVKLVLNELNVVARVWLVAYVQEMRVFAELMGQVAMPDVDVGGIAPMHKLET